MYQSHQSTPAHLNLASDSSLVFCRKGLGNRWVLCEKQMFLTILDVTLVDLFIILLWIMFRFVQDWELISNW